ncbi:MAG: hypothetical protein IBX48_00920 [Thiomicrospira sp.]|uniref:hypothetical protein n=1 Tax=Thiomicrospira sp. TaxID=935 RepID=UPI0019F80E1C|nr:hypothetical protein [Thiomicrospira sp.]MBE0492880.1 hypothetical protein [Thiomicrospira sp.]
MKGELTFRLHETTRFLKAVLLSSQGRKFLVGHIFNTLLLAFVLVISFGIVLIGLYDGFQIRRRTLAVSFSILFTLLIIVPMAVMPFFSFKDLTNRINRFIFKRDFFTSLSHHVFYHQARDGEITLHLAKAHSVLAEKHQLFNQSNRQTVRRELSLSIAKSIREAVRISKDLVKNGRLKSDQKIVGATYGYLFGAAKSKLKLKRIQPAWFKRYIGNIFYRFGALHAVFMYFVINDKLPPAFDPVYFKSTVGDVIGTKNIQIA